MAESNTKLKNTQKKKSEDEAGIKDIRSADVNNENGHTAENLKKLLGLLMMLSSVFMMLSFISYLLFSWKTDMNQVSDFKSFISTMPESSQNWMRKAGAFTGHLFIYRWFGVSSFLFVFIFFIAGFRLFFKRSLVPFWKSIATSFFLIFWISITCGLFLKNINNILGGGFGMSAHLKLNSLIGYVGTIMLLLFVIIGYFMLVYGLPVPEIILTAFKRKRNLAPETITGTDENPKTAETEKEQYQPEDFDKEKPEPEIQDEPFEFELKSQDTQETTKKTSKTKEIDLEIEKIPEQIEVSEESHAEKSLTPKELDPLKAFPGYKFPTIDLLKIYDEKQQEISQEELEERKNLIIQTLRNYNIEIDRIKATVGPTVTLYEIVPAAGVRISKIRNLEDDIALSLSALGIRIIAPIPGKGTIGIEVPNKKPEIVSVRSVFSSPKFQNFNKELPIALGKTISNEVYVADLAKMPHLLIAGATGQGKSVGINVIISSLLYKKHPSQLKFVMIDPKKVELSIYQRIEKHYLAKLPNVSSSIITEVSDVVQTLNSLLAELDNRMKLFNLIPVRNITEYNTKFLAGILSEDAGHHYLPYIVLIIDELADLMLTAGKEVEMPIARLAQIARAFGIHLIVSTQRPSVNIITGTIKANFPARISYKVVSMVDSRTILDHKGAEQLIGYGDMLLSMGSDIIRLQCPLIETFEVENIIDFVAGQAAESEMMMLPEVETVSIDADGDLEDIDPMFEEAARIVVQHQQGSTSLIQRRLKLGYNRAGRIMDQLEQAGIVGPLEGSKARTVLISDEYALEQFLKDLFRKK